MGQLWGGRFDKKEMDKDVMKFTSSLDIDKVLSGYDCLSSKVHVEMLSKIGLLSPSEKEELLDILDKLLEEIKSGTFEACGHEDIHSAIQDYVENKAPISAGKLHTARSRNEQVVNDVRLYCKDKIEGLKELIIEFQKALVGLAESTIEIVVPGYTHLNRAQPVLFAHLVMAYVEMLGRDYGRLMDAKARMDVSVMGSGAIGGSSLKVDRAFVAEKLGFKSASANSIDAVSDRDFIIEFVSALTLISVHLSRISEDFILYSIPEFGLLDMGSEFCTGSSLMPQKKNPDVLELVRGKSASCIGNLNALFVLLKGLAHSYNRDLQEDKKPLFESVETVSGSLLLMTKLVRTVKLKKENALMMLEDEFIYATDLAEYLVQKGIAFKDAHETVGKIVKYCVEKSIGISDLSIQELKNFCEKIDGDVYGLLNPEVSVGNKKGAGSTNPSFVKKEIERWGKKLGM